MAAPCPHTFSLGSHNSQVSPLVTRGLLLHVLNFMKSIHKICLHSTQLYGVLKNSKRGGGINQISQKEELSLTKTKCYLVVISPCTILVCPFQKGPLSFSLHKQRIYMETYLKKPFWFVLVPYPHRQNRKRMMKTLLIISRCM